jgi:N-Acetylglucosaminyltransferase-IV (GnT-IV) conserved region
MLHKNANPEKLELNVSNVSSCVLGKLFRSNDLPFVVEFILMFYRDKPVDWLLDHLLYVKICSPEKDMVIFFRSISFFRFSIQFYIIPDLLQAYYCQTMFGCVRKGGRECSYWLFFLN